MKVLVTFYLVLMGILVISASPVSDNCEPYGVRLSLGKFYSDLKQSQKMSIIFNTKKQCSKSYVILNQGSNIIKRYCEQPISLLFGNYESHVHDCKFDDIKLGEIFKYNVFGWTGEYKDSPVAFHVQNIQTMLFDPENPFQVMKFVFLADWSPLGDKALVYDDIVPSLESLVEKNQINAIIVDGDIGYDLDSNDCQNYQDYIKMISKITIKIPIIHATGNHEYNSKINFEIYQKSFHLLDLDLKKVAGINMGSFYLTLLDPYQYLYPSVNPQDKMLQYYQDVLKTGAQMKKPMISASHYPLICSGSPDCTKDIEILKQFWKLMLQYKVGLHIGAHYHTYQRSYPLLQNFTIANIDPPYNPARDNYLLSIVQGVAGNRKSIVQKLKKIQTYTAAYTQNETGFGILTVQYRSNSFLYQHYSCKGSLHSADSMKFSMNQKKYQLTGQTE